MDGVDDVAFLAGSEPRAAVLSALSGTDDLTKDDLVERTGAARVTVSRNLEKLADRGLVEGRTGRWRLTPLGELLAREFLGLVETARTAEDLAPVLRRLPPEEFDLDPAALAGATVTASTEANPYAPVERHGETLLAADRARLLLPAVSRRLMSRSEQRLRRGDLELELVVAASVAETFRTSLQDLIGDLLTTGALTVHEYDGPVPFYLGLVDEHVQLGVSDRQGIPRALAETDDPTVREWAEPTYRSYRSAATAFDADELRTDTP